MIQQTTVVEYIRTQMSAPPTATCRLKPEIQADSFAPISEDTFGTRWSGFASTALDSTLGLLTNSCAGAAHGIVRGAQFEGDTAEHVFDAAFAANLILVGASAYGPAAAIGILAAGQAYWAQQPQEARAKIFETVDHYVDAVVAKLPPSEHPGVFRLVGQAAIGEIAGVIGGAVAGGRSLSDNGAAA